MRTQHVLRMVLITIAVAVAGCWADSPLPNSRDTVRPLSTAVVSNATPTAVEEATAVPALAGRVNDTPIYFEAYQRQVDRQYLNASEATSAVEAGRQAMQTLIEQTLIEQQCARLGLTVTDNELDSAIEQNIGANTNLQSWLAANGFTETELRQYFKQQLLAARLYEHITQSVPTTADQAYIQYILVADGATAQTIITRLKNGADFTQAGQTAEQTASVRLVKNYSTLPAKLEEIIFNLQPGQIHGPVKTEQGYFIIHLLEKSTNHPIDAPTLQHIKQQFFLDWLQQQQADANIVINITF